MVLPKAQAVAEGVNELRAKVARKLEANPGIKTAMLADTLGVPEAQILRAMPEGRARELDPSKAEQIISGLENLGLFYVVCRNPVTVMEVKGRFGGFSHSGPFFNVAGENLHMHLKLGEVGAIFAVEATQRDGGQMHSIQFFDQDGCAAFKVFLIKSFQDEAGDDYSAHKALFLSLIEQFD